MTNGPLRKVPYRRGPTSWGCQGASQQCQSKVEIVQGIILGQLRIVQQVWPVAMDEGTEGKTIL